VRAIAGGGHHTCALMTTGGVRCWGRNADGELGDGTTTDRTTPSDSDVLTAAEAVPAPAGPMGYRTTPAPVVICQ
jgi:alpha-tubulin suppressor-like RCC1 family protein